MCPLPPSSNSIFSNIIQFFPPHPILFKPITPLPIPSIYFGGTLAVRGKTEEEKKVF